jgi:hypothetical protein
MGAWGINTFENDGALDWLGSFIDNPSETRFSETFNPRPTAARVGFLSRLFGKPAPLPAELDGEDVLAAAEVVAALRGLPASTNGDTLAGLPAFKVSDEIVTKALKALDSVLESSNLRECWAETDEYESWVATVKNIRQRLSQA